MLIVFTEKFKIQYYNLYNLFRTYFYLASRIQTCTSGIFNDLLKSDIRGEKNIHRPKNNILTLGTVTHEIDKIWGFDLSKISGQTKIYKNCAC